MGGKCGVGSENVLLQIYDVYDDIPSPSKVQIVNVVLGLGPHTENKMQCVWSMTKFF